MSLVWNVIYLDNQWKWLSKPDGVSRIHQRCLRGVNVGIDSVFKMKLQIFTFASAKRIKKVKKLSLTKN